MTLRREDLYLLAGAVILGALLGLLYAQMYG